MELWNHLTMSYRRHDDRNLEPVPQRSVDTGMGLKRLLMVAYGRSSVLTVTSSSLDDRAVGTAPWLPH